MSAEGKARGGRGLCLGGSLGRAVGRWGRGDDVPVARRQFGIADASEWLDRDLRDVRERGWQV